jgi:aspartyl-tRNA(Asn)/glutamyl-tRNA(Gln) amidotransferase subunit B
MEYEAVIGLEVHAQLKTESKIFCGCSTRFGAEPNSQSCPVCLGLPGVLPVLNKKALEYAIRAAIALDCEVATYSKFDRKNYFYPDLPKDYQISQYDKPLAVGGRIDIISDGRLKRIGITRVHLEEDAGKLMHDQVEGSSLVDFNRCGVPLIEIVSQPDIRSAQETYDYLIALKSILQFIDVSDCNMEEGSLRCDANVSICLKGRDKLGTKVELKNMNSFHGVVRALEYEINRQKEVLEEGARVVQETRLWDEGLGITTPMRQKEEAQDYRYFPEPDLIPIAIDSQWVREIKKTLPELPKAKYERFMREYNIPAYDAGVLTSSRKLADYYEECVRLYDRPKAISNWIMSELLRELKTAGIEIDQSRVTPERLTRVLKLIDEGIISGKMAKEIFVEVFKTGRDADEVVKARGLAQISDEEKLSEIIDQVLQENPGSVQDYRGGKEKALGYLAGQVMKATRGQANPKLANRLLREKLGT